MENFDYLKTPGLRQHTLHDRWDKVIHAIMAFIIFLIILIILKLQLSRIIMDFLKVLSCCNENP